jgi:hypothetical protein
MTADRSPADAKALTIRHVVSLVLLFLLSSLGFQGALGGVHSAETLGQQAHTAIQLAAAVAGMAAAVGLWAQRRWTHLPLLMWAILITLTGGLAPVIWGGAGWAAGLRAGAASAAIAGVVVWLAGGWQAEREA